MMPGWFGDHKIIDGIEKPIWENLPLVISFSIVRKTDFSRK